MLQDILMKNLINEAALGSKIQNGTSVSNKGQFALDATEKNPNIQDTLAEQIASNANRITRVKNALDSIIALPDGESTVADGEIAAAKVGPSGESYTTLQEAISKQIEDYKGVSVSNNKPDNDSHINVWVNTGLSDTESFGYEVPQIDDENISEVDTWSSAKINALFEVMSTEVVDSEGNKINLGELLDDRVTSYHTVWSSSKTRTEILATLTNISDGNGGTINLLELIDDTADSTDRVWSAKKVIDAIKEVDDKIVPTDLTQLETRLTNLSALVSDLQTSVETIGDISGITTSLNTLNEKVETLETNLNLAGGEDGQFPVSDGNGGIRWVTIPLADNMEF